MMGRYVSPEELRRLVSALLVALGFLGLVALFAFIVVPGLRYQAHTVPEGLAPAAAGETGWLDPTDYPPTRKQVLPPIDPATVITPTSTLLERGRVLYSQNCVACHGPGGRGDGPGGHGLKPPPRDFTAAGGWTRSPTIEDIFRTLTEGSAGTSMSSYSYLTKRDRMALVHHVRSLAAFPPVPSDPSARASLESLFLTSGETVPNRIPVRAAVAALVREHREPPAPSSKPGHPLVTRLVVDAARAARTLAATPHWASADEALAQGVLSNLGNNGFAPEAARLDRAQWTVLRRALAGEVVEP